MVTPINKVTLFFFTKSKITVYLFNEKNTSNIWFTKKWFYTTL